MSITQYTNFERINQKIDNEGKFLQDKDAFIVSNNEIEDSDFGECKYDVMEVSVYDINNNLLPQKSGDNIAYIKTGDIKNYLYNITNNRGKKEVAIDIKKLLETLGFKNGILRANINFVRNKVGDEDISRRVWIQEISPSRTEIRILPLKVVDANITEKNNSEFSNLQNLNKDFKYVKQSMLNSIYSFQMNFLDSITSNLESKYGKDFFNTLRKDFGLRDFDDLKKKIYDDFKISVEYYLTNKYYWVNEENFGKQSELRFEDCEQYDFEIITKEIENILHRCIEVSTTFLKRRDFNILETPKEFKQVELAKETQDNIATFETPTKEANIIFSQNDVEIKPTDPPPTIVSEEPADIVPIPPKIVVEVQKPHYSYYIKNTNSLRSVLLTFTDASGATVQKSLGPGLTITICALEDSVSFKETTNISNSKALLDVRDISDEGTKLNYTITKIANCNTVDIGEGAPLQLSPETLPPKGNPPVVRSSSGGGGVTREESNLSTNQNISSLGSLQSNNTIAQTIDDSSTLMFNTSGIRQTTITGPTID